VSERNRTVACFERRTPEQKRRPGCPLSPGRSPSPHSPNSPDEVRGRKAHGPLPMGEAEDQPKPVLPLLGAGIVFRKIKVIPASCGPLIFSDVLAHRRGANRWRPVCGARSSEWPISGRPGTGRMWRRGGFPCGGPGQGILPAGIRNPQPRRASASSPPALRPAVTVRSP